jgi:Tfp pilus assembly protein PilF
MSSVFTVLRILVVLALLTGTAAAQPGRESTIDAGWAAIKQGNGSVAAAAFEAALKQRPDDPLLHYGAGVAAYLLGRQGDAAESLTRALALNPRLIPAIELLGEVEYLQGHLDAAIERYEAAIAGASRPDVALQRRLAEWRKEATVNRNLTTSSSARFAVSFNGRSDSSLAAHVEGVLDRAFWRIGENIGAYPPNRVLVVLYTEQQFRDITRGPAWASGAFDGKVRIPVKGVSHDRDDLDRVLVHELSHAIVHGLAPQGVPAWLHEGLARYFEPADVAGAQQRVIASGVVIPFAELQEGFRRFDARTAAAAYDQSLVAVDLLARTLGSRMATLLRALGRGQSFREAMGQVGLVAGDFEEQVLRRLK